MIIIKLICSHIYLIGLLFSSGIYNIKAHVLKLIVMKYESVDYDVSTIQRYGVTVIYPQYRDLK